MNKLGILREVLSSLKRRKPAKKYCPKCGSPHIRFSTQFDLWLLPEQYVCEKCGYRGPIVLEVEEGNDVTNRKS